MLSDNYKEDAVLNIIGRTEGNDEIILRIDKAKLYPKNSNLLIGIIRPSSEGYIILIKNGSSYDDFDSYMKDNGVNSLEDINFYYKFNNAVIKEKTIKFFG